MFDARVQSSVSLSNDENVDPTITQEPVEAEVVVHGSWGIDESAPS